jgi:cytochrome oxidase Cu insertion factor (SCO1/SenC/PrrC family)
MLSVRRLVLYFGIATLLAIAAVVGLVWHWDARQAQTSAGEALIGGPFTLTDQHGKEVTEKDFAGRYMLIYFGYTFCPDVCPTSLTVMAAALDRLPQQQAEQVVPIFITVDPARDTVEQLAAYAPLFHPRLVALTGSEDEVREAARAWRVYYHVPDEEGDAYLVDHSTFVYLMGPDGSYRTHFGIDASPEAMAEAIGEEIAASG